MHLKIILEMETAEMGKDKSKNKQTDSAESILLMMCL